MMNDRIYQEIYDEISSSILPNCEWVVIYLEYGEESYSYSFYEKIDSEYMNGYDLPGVSEKKIDDTFKRIDKMIMRERKKEKAELWSNMTLSISKSGDVRADFDYTDLSDGNYQYKKDWKKKYLK